jgi:hypothetical protein
MTETGLAILLHCDRWYKVIGQALFWFLVCSNSKFHYPFCPYQVLRRSSA